MSNTLIIIILVICICFSGFFSATEIIYSKVNKLRLQKMAENGSKSAKNALDLANNFTKLLSTILIGNNLVNILASSLATILFNSLWPSLTDMMIVIIMTAIILVFGEICPKTIFGKFTLTSSKVFSFPLKVFEIIFKPVVFVITKFIDLLSPIWTPKEDEEEDTSGEELINMVEQIEEDGYIDDDTKELVTSAIELKDTTAEEIMTPRVDVFGFDISDDIKELLNSEDLFKYSRLLVYEDNIDNILGVVNTRSLIQKALDKEEINIKEMFIEPIYVHKTKAITGLLKTFKDTKTHIAIVVDEFGGTLGIITLEDVLEEIVGDIWDEMDEVEEEIVQSNDTTFIIDGDMNLYDMFETVGYDVDDEFECAYSTVGGWCTEVLDHFPVVKDTFTFDNLVVTILEVDGVRVEKVRIEVIEILADEDIED